MSKAFQIARAAAVALVFASCASPTANEPILVESADTVVTSLNEQIRQDPGNPELYHARAKQLLVNNELEPAFNDIKRAVELDSSSADYFKTLGEIYFRQGEGSRSLQAFKKAGELDPENTEALLKEAELYLLLSDYPEAIRAADKALRVDKYLAEAYFMKGMAFKYAGDTLTALSSFQTAVEQNPEYYEAYMQLGLVLFELKDPASGDYLRNAINVNPSNTEARYAMGMLAQQNEQVDEAIKLYRGILQLDSTHRDALYNLGYVHSEIAGDLVGAIPFYQQVTELYPDDRDAWYMLGYARERTGDKSGAEAAYRKALAIDPQYELPAMGLSRVL